MIRYILLAPLDILGCLFFNLFVNWWAALFANEQGWLPNWLKWAQTFDASLDTGIIENKFKKSKSLWFDRTRWLYRNSSYGWSYYVLGIPYKHNTWTRISTGNPAVFYAKSSEGYFHYTRRTSWGTIKLGWKAGNLYNHEFGIFVDTKWGPEYRVPIVTSLSLRVKDWF